MKKWLSSYNNENELRDVIFLDNVEAFDSTFYVCGNNVALLNCKTKTPTAILICNSSYAQTQREIFNSVWKNKKRKN